MCIGGIKCVYLVCIGGIKCPVCEFVYGTKWELNRHLKNKHNLKLMEGPGSWEVHTHTQTQTQTQTQRERERDRHNHALVDLVTRLNIAAIVFIKRLFFCQTT